MTTVEPNTYQDIISELISINSTIPVDIIEKDVEDLIVEYLIHEIKDLKVQKYISQLDFRKEILKAKLRSSRQTKTGKKFSDKKLKREESYFKLKSIQNYFKRKDISSTLEYSGTSLRSEIEYLNVIDKSYFDEKKIIDDDKVESKIIYESSINEDKSTFIENQILNDGGFISIKSEDNISNTRMGIDLYKESEDKKKLIKKKKIPIKIIDPELKEEILNFEVKPLEKEKPRDFSILEFIGFVDKDEYNDNNS